MLALALVTLFAPLPQGRAQSYGGSPVPQPLAPSRNLAFAAGNPAELGSAGELVVFSVDELDHGQGSLNGDRGDLDAQDDVLFVVDLARGATTALGEVGAYAFVGDRLLLTLGEQANGAADLDGDGDALDFVLHAFDGTSLVDLGLASAGVTAVGDNAVVLGLEDGHVDLNGDGDRLDTVFHLYRAGVLTNLGLASELGAFGLGDEIAVLLVSEAAQGASDGNGDGDASDSVPVVLDLASGALRVVPRAVDPEGAPSCAGPLAAFVLSEADQQNDANFDGDQDDDVVLVYDHALGFTRSTHLAVQPQGGFVHTPVQVGRGFAVFVSGLGQLQLHDVATNTTTNTGLAADAFGLRVCDEHAAFRVFETGADRNGDGDLGDTVLYLLDGTSGVVRNLGLAAEFELVLTRDLLVFGVRESSQGFLDRNGDGDADDEVAAVLELASGRLRNTGLAGTWSAATRTLATVSVSEAAQGGLDRTGDGDADDHELVLVEGASGKRTPIGVGHAPARGSRWVPFLVNESELGADRNGDGDTFDEVVHVQRVGRP